MKKLLWCLPALALLGCGGEDCHTEIESQDGTSVCLPDPSEKKGVCVQDPKPGGPANACDGHRPCDGVLALEVFSEGKGYAGVCSCEPKDEVVAWCDGKLRDVVEI